MISYCVVAYRPAYARLLIEELIRKNPGPCEILVWINAADEPFVEFVKEKEAAGTPVRLIRWTPNNIGMRAFKELFLAAKYDMLVQIDDDVLRVSPDIPTIAKGIFERHDVVRQLVADVIQDPFTTGAKGGPSSYALYNGADRLYKGPIDGWFSVYHRSILPILLDSPYDLYFYLGAHVRGVLESRGMLGLLCGRMKVFHVAGPVYAHHHGLLDGEVEKFRRANMQGMADGYAKYRDKPHSRARVEEQLQKGFDDIDSFKA